MPRAYTKPEMVVSKMLRDMKVRYYSQVTIYTKVREKIRAFFQT